MTAPDSLAPLAHQVPDVCRRLGLARTTIYELIKTGELRSFTVGTRRLVSEAALLEFIAAHEKVAA